jgi:hypothetical protein
MDIGNPVNKGAIVTEFIAAVKSPVWGAVSLVPDRWGSDAGFRPWSPNIVGVYAVDYNHSLLGTRAAEPDPVWPAYESSGAGILATTNAFFILHTFALKLTRHRQAHGYLRMGSFGVGPAHPPGVGIAGNYVYLGMRLTSYRADSIVWFDPPIPASFPSPTSLPSPGDVVTAAHITDFMTQLLARVNAIRNDVGHASDIVGCHASCHSSCHGSRGRR